jgi:Xaa-Pro dipeptidase
MHKLATRTCLNALINAGVLQGALDDVVEAKLGPVFMPHGLGHLLGGGKFFV